MPALFVALALAPGVTAAQKVDVRIPGVSAGVTEMATHGSTLYLAGGFVAAGTNSGGGIPVDLAAGHAIRPYPKVAGSVYACVPDGRGGWFIGGEFDAVGGVQRSNLAHVTAAGAVSDWTADSDGRVNTLAVQAGILYVGGRFEHLRGMARSCLASVDASSGEILPWNPTVSGVSHDFTTVLALAVRESVLYVGGDFTRIAGADRLNLAAVSLRSGAATPFSADADDKVHALASTDSTLYVGGAFGSIAGVPRRLLAAVSRTLGEVTDFNPIVESAYYSFDRTPFVASIALDDTLAYFVGHFTRVGSQVRGGIASVRISTGAVTDWDPRPIDESRLMWAPFINAVQVRDGIAYIGGLLDTLGGQKRYGAGAVSTMSGLATEWRPRMLTAAFVLALGEGKAYLGGGFTLDEDWEPRSYLASIDLANGALLPWQPECDAAIGAIAADSTTVYIGGGFTRVNGEPRAGLAALDRTTGELLPWNPGVGGSFGVVTTLALVGPRLLVGGDFVWLAGSWRPFLGSVDTRTGLPDEWAPSPSSLVISMAVDGHIVYLTGLFTSIGGQSRQSCAAVDVESGAVTPWDPSPDVFAESIAVGDDAVYLGGPFRSVGAASRESIAAVDKTTGTATDWDPAAEMWHPYGGARVNSILVLDSTVYVGGDFAKVGGADRNLVAALSPTTGLARDWNVEMVGDAVTSLAAWGDNLYVGGVFTRMGVHPVSGIGACSIARFPPPDPSALVLAPSFPNPAATTVAVSFALPTATNVTLEVFDIVGRLVASILRSEERPAGWNQVSMDVQGWQPGCYVYRLVAGSQSVAGKLFVVH